MTLRAEDFQSRVRSGKWSCARRSSRDARDEGPLADDVIRNGLAWLQRNPSVGAPLALRAHTGCCRLGCTGRTGAIHSSTTGPATNSTSRLWGPCSFPH